MPKTKSTSKIDDDIQKKQEQITKLEERLQPLLEKRDKLNAELKALHQEKEKIKFSELVGVLRGVEGIDNLSAEQIQKTLQQAAQSVSIDTATSNES
ncbi:hypothetical protein [Agarilytica rhodophyticola]|uniref:hypothetical protein n=1 Tax=Agarilytica rhodophyticola TaxID=1737490 RepID=UPI000CD962F4|nr:hypothetical protein [Agarilytica rhodophyticola]